VITRRYYVERRGWTAERLAMTHGLIETMVGYRTRLAQEQPERWHLGEDQALGRYLVQSRVHDRWATLIQILPSRAWLLVSLLVLLPAFADSSTSPASLGLGLAGMLSAYFALRKLPAGLLYSVGALIAWQQVADLFHIAGRPQALATGLTPERLPGANGHAGEPLIEANGLAFRYDDRTRLVLQDCSLLIRHGDRLLLEGPSGGGKSTLISLLNGLRKPESGLILLDGFDLHSVGSDGWRRQIVSAPQFHENHVFTETFAFNLLMGRRWPPSFEDLQEAEEICHELGLGPLLERMPAGMMQMVGESGWQLSHGERSRLFIARALLQGATMILLDESFGALDPEMLELALRCVLRRAPTLLVIAHP
jgi:ATP-binding cassette subfamily B protein